MHHSIVLNIEGKSNGFTRFSIEIEYGERDIASNDYNYLPTETVDFDKWLFDHLTSYLEDLFF